METVRIGLGDLLREHGERPQTRGEFNFGNAPRLPVRRHVRFRRNWRRCFLLNLRRSGSIAEAAESAGVKPEHVATRRGRHQDFDAECERMLKEYAVRQEARARRRERFWHLGAQTASVLA